MVKTATCHLEYAQLPHELRSRSLGCGPIPRLPKGKPGRPRKTPGLCSCEWSDEDWQYQECQCPVCGGMQMY